MPRGKKFTAEQIIGKFREAEVGLAQGKTVPEVVRKLGVTEQTYYRWKREYCGLRTDQATRFQLLFLDRLANPYASRRAARASARLAHPPTGASSFRPMTIATSFNRRLTRYLRSTSAASERCRKRGTNEAAMRPDEESLCADARKPTLQAGEAGDSGTVCGASETAARGSPAAHDLGNAGGSAIGRAILRRFPQQVYRGWADFCDAFFRCTFFTPRPPARFVQISSPGDAVGCASSARSAISTQGVERCRRSKPFAVARAVRPPVRP
jgi:hypothetical protein